jgi:hypothetical protein
MSVTPFSTRNRTWAVGLTLGLLVLILPLSMAQSSTATLAISGCNNPRSLEQCGIGFCEIGPSVTNFCLMTITFPTPFSATPSHVTATLNGLESSTGNAFPNIIATPSASVVFEADNGTTWYNMPSAVTELYGNSNHESTYSIPAGGFPLDAVFTVSCLLGSNGTGTYLQPQFLYSGTWTELAANHGFMNVDVTQADQDCGPNGFGTVVISSTTSAVNSHYMIGDYLRVVGANGNGTGDDPIFNNIWLEFLSTKAIVASICVNLGFQCPDTGGNPLASKTQMIIDVWLNEPADLSGNYAYVWVDWSAWK